MLGQPFLCRLALLSDGVELFLDDARALVDGEHVQEEEPDRVGVVRRLVLCDLTP